VAQLFADREGGFAVDLALRRREFQRLRAAGRLCRPSGQLAVAGLRLLVAVAVNAVHAGRGALVLEAPQLLDVAALGRDEAAPPAGAFASSSTWRCSALRIGISRDRSPVVRQDWLRMLPATLPTPGIRTIVP